MAENESAAPWFTRRVSPAKPPALGPSFRAFFDEFGALDREAFLARFPGPFLVTAFSLDPETWPRAIVVPVVKRRRAPGIVIAADGGDALSPDDPASPNRISLGRGSENDVTLPVPSVSKRHAYFMRRDKAWVVADVGSSNGTRVNGMELRPHSQAKLTRSPSPVEFGPDVRLLFFTPESFHELVVEARASAGLAGAAPRPAVVRAVDAPRADWEDFQHLGFSRADPAVSTLFPRQLEEEGDDLVRTHVDEDAQVRRGAADASVASTQVDGLADAYSGAMSVVGSLGELITALEVVLLEGNQTVELYRAGSGASFAQASQQLSALRDHVSCVRVTLAVGDRAPVTIYARPETA